MAFRQSDEGNHKPEFAMPQSRGRNFLVFCLSLACLFLLIDIFWILPRIWPPGRDFPLLWAASSLAREGQAAAAYDPARLRAVKQNIIDPFVWYYPPTFLLMVLPLSLLPYVASQIAWIGVTLSGYLFVLRRIAPHYVTILLGLAFPGAVINLIFSHNGYLSVAFLGSGLLLLDRAPLAGGALLGMMSYKPQLAILIPVALAAGRRWKALLGAGAAALGLALVSIMVLGFESWIAFSKRLSIHVMLVETGVIPWRLVPTTFAAARFAGAGPTLAFLLQGLVMVATLAAVVWVWFKEAPLAIRASVLVLCALLFPYYFIIYDLTLLALPLAWLWWEGHTKGWAQAEQLLLLHGWLAPVASPFLEEGIRFPIVPLALAGLLVITLLRYGRISREAAGTMEP